MMRILDKIRHFIIWRTLQRRTQHPIYIIPTIDGLKVLGLNFLLLVIGLIYANNYVLLFNFILFCLVLGSMFYTHHNLRGLKILFAGIEHGHELEGNLLKINFQSTNPEGHDRIDIEVFHHDLISFSNTPFYYPFRSMIESHQMYLIFKGRGKKKFKYIGASTSFPLGFFKAFTFFNVDCSFYCYPERIDQHLSILDSELGRNEEKEETELKSYRVGDPLKRVDWKKLAKSNQWYTKSLIGDEDKIIYLDLDSKHQKFENLLKQASYMISSAEINGIEYGIKINHQVVLEAARGSAHQENCLRFISDL